MNVTYYGHACFGVQLLDRSLLFDPFISGNPQAAAVDVNSIPADVIFISHGHQDHLADAIPIAQRTGATIVAAYEVANWLAKNGAPKVHALNHGGSFVFDSGRAKFVNAIHSSTLPDGSYGGNPGGFVVESSDGNFYFSGDTALHMDMKLIGESTRLNFAALCLGGNYTMDVHDAVKAAQFINCDHILGIHFDTFPPVAIDHTQAHKLFQAAGKTLHLLKIGESRQF